MRYTVELYDKDNDNILTVLETDDKSEAIISCRAIYETMLRAYVLNKNARTEVTSTEAILSGQQLQYELFDWVDVYDSQQKKIIFVNNIKEV